MADKVENDQSGGVDDLSEKGSVGNSSHFLKFGAVDKDLDLANTPVDSGFPCNQSWLVYFQVRWLPVFPLLEVNLTSLYRYLQRVRGHLFPHQ